MDRIGRYKIVRELGRGAMGVVYHAIDPNIGRPVAIKTIQLGGPRKPEEQERLRERLFREARSAGILSHPGIVTIYDVEKQGDLAYIAMEYVDGVTLDQYLGSEEPVPSGRLFSILAQTAAALDFAHQKGIIHRDIKPANIMIAGDGAVKVTDFGIAKITASEQFTMTGSIVGTPHYMSPEQVQGQQVDGRSDQFSLAVIAFEMLTGEKPYTGEHLTTVVYKIVAEEPLAPHRLNPSLSGPIDGVLRKGLAKKADGRYRTCQEFVDALEKACAATRGWKALARGGGLSEPTAMDAAPPVNLPPARRARPAETVAEPPAKPKRGFLAFLLALLLVAGLLAFIGWQADPALPQKVQAISQKIQAALGVAAPAPVEDRRAVAQSAPPPAQAQPPAVPGDIKPSPMPPPETAPPSDQAAPGAEAAPEAAPAPSRIRTAAAAPQRISIVSSPAGASVTLDGRIDAACVTPCSLSTTPGRHTITITLAGYQAEYRDVTVGSSPVELPPVVLRAPSGTLMLTTVPDGAAVSIDGRRLPQTTPATIPLPPGNHTVLVEKAGRQASSQVEVRNGAISYLRIVLEQ